MSIVGTARHLMAVLQPLMGDRSEGTVTIATRADVATLAIPKNYTLLPLRATTRGKPSLSPQMPFRTTEAITATPAGVEVGVTSILGGLAYNLPASTSFVPASEDNRIASVEASTALAGATAYEGTGALKDVLVYESIGSSQAQRDLFLAKLVRTPAAVIVWESSAHEQNVGTDKTKVTEQWSIHVVVSRADAGELRALEGLEILDLVSELLGRRSGIDGAAITNGDIKILSRARTAVADSAYIYSLRIQTGTTITRTDDRVFDEWLTTSYTLVSTPPDLALSPSVVTFVDDAVYDQNPETDP